MAAPMLWLASSSKSPFCKAAVRSLVAARASAAVPRRIPLIKIRVFITLLFLKSDEAGRKELSWICKINRRERKEELIAKNPKNAKILNAKYSKQAKGGHTKKSFRVFRVFRGFPSLCSLRSLR